MGTERGNELLDVRQLEATTAHPTVIEPLVCVGTVTCSTEEGWGGGLGKRGRIGPGSIIYKNNIYSKKWTQD